MLHLPALKNVQHINVPGLYDYTVDKTGKNMISLKENMRCGKEETVKKSWYQL